LLAKRTIDEVIQQARVEEVISDFMTLRKRGINYEGLCPFHNEKSPSFKVNPVKGIYKCFGCGKAGSSIQFVMEHEGMSFIDAIKFLASKYGIELIEENSKRSEEYDEQVRIKESLYAAIDFAQNFYVENLQTEEGKIAGLAYLKERGFTVETIRKFGLGYAPGGFDTFTKTALKQGFNEQILLDAGLIKRSEKGSYFDFFRERVQFPFFNVAGKIVAFGGRIIKKDERGPKYLNSPETPIYIKSKILFGIFQAKNAIKKTDMCYLVEGYTDVISLHQAGIENVVASSGTSLTED
jgi:DNA primase